LALTLLSLPIGTAYGVWPFSSKPTPSAPGSPSKAQPSVLQGSVTEIQVPLGQEVTMAKKDLPIMQAIANKLNRKPEPKQLPGTKQMETQKSCQMLLTPQLVNELRGEELCDSLCFFGRLWKYAPQFLKQEVGEACGCYCSYKNKHPKAYEALKDYILDYIPRPPYL
jgi:hypothetical protein